MNFINDNYLVIVIGLLCAALIVSQIIGRRR